MDLIDGLAIMPGVDDIARERLALSILTLAALGFRAFYPWLDLARPILAPRDPVRYCKPVFVLYQSRHARALKIGCF